MSEGQLAAAGGKVRCGACQTAFDGRAQLLVATRVPTPTTRGVDDLGIGTRTYVPRSTLSTIGWTLLNLALIVTLAGQYAYHHRAALAAQPALRPGVELLCRVARCDLPPWRDLTAFELTSRNVQSHPKFDRVLLLDATFVNRSARPQPYPDLLVTFLDSAERAVARRRFSPADYLPAPPTTPLTAGAEAHVVLEILDPGDRALGYEFTFM
ncbi:MAG: DUF3426 domain-containing protein [Gammaproteobacteria bacterium]|nr:DUF3426 domain-containing protein [Gammaproteobacteria bacterium]